MKNRLLGFYQDEKELMEEIDKAIKEYYLIPVASRNIRLMVDNGVVILSGEVFMEQEKITIGHVAMFYAGPCNVDNQIVVMEEME